MSQHAPNIPPSMAHDEPRHASDTVGNISPPLRATVEEAAKLLGTSANTIRKRIERGTLSSEKVDGVRYVLLSDTDIPEHATDTADGSATDMSRDLALMQAHLDSMQEQVGYLKAVVQTRDEELRRKDHIIAALTERIPELEPPREAPRGPRESPTAATEDTPGTSPPPDEERPSWLKRFFGFQ